MTTQKQPHAARAEIVLQYIPIKDLIPTPDNPRAIDAIDTDAQSFQELLNSVLAIGVQEPVLARPHPAKKGQYDMRYGNRRLRAARMAKLDVIPCIVKNMNDREAVIATATENHVRDDLTPMQESALVSTMLKKFDHDIAAVAGELGESARWVKLRETLANLSPKWRAAYGTPTSFVSAWSAGHLALIARYPQEVQAALFNETSYSCPTVAELAATLAQYEHLLSAAPFDLESKVLDKKARACTECDQRSSCQGLLFNETADAATIKKTDRCLNTACWDRKVEAHQKLTVRAALKANPDAIKISANQNGGNNADAYQPWQFRDAKKMRRAREPPSSSTARTLARSSRSLSPARKPPLTSHPKN